MWLANTKVDVTQHLASRIRQWIVLRLAADVDQDGILEKHLWTIANRIVSTLVWDEKKAVAQALDAGNSPPSPPSYNRPADVDALLGEAVMEELPALDQGTKDHIWKLFDGTLLPMIGNALPLCPSNFGEGANDKLYGFSLLCISPG